MKKIFVVLSLAAAFAMASAAHADSSKLDGWLKIMHSNPSHGKALLSKTVSLSGETTLVDCLLKSSDVAATKAAIEAEGGIVGATLKTIMTARIPIDKLDLISDRGEILRLEAARELKTKMNAARAFTHVDDVQAGTGLDKAYDGSGVMVGAVDEGLNWSNDDFDGPGGTRVAWIGEKASSGGSIFTLYCYKEDIDGGTCEVDDGGSPSSGGHGTHVTGIAAGQNGTYTGVAPRAWIGFMFDSATDANSSGTMSTAVVEGVDEVFAAADELDIAAVVNLSLGTSLGAHDNTSLLEDGLNELGTDVKGRIIVNAAGNENVNPNPFDAITPGSSAYIGGIHADIDVATGSDKAWRFGVWSPYAVSYSFLGAVEADVWLSSGDESNCVIGIKAYDSSSSIIPPTPSISTTAAALATTELPFTPEGESIVSDAGNKVQVSLNTLVETANSKPHAIVLVGPGSSGTASDVTASLYVYDIVIRATSGTCTGNIWLYQDQTLYNDFLKAIDTLSVTNGTKGNGYDYANGDSFKTTTIPGTASGVVTAGSYMGRGTWVDIDGVTHHQDVYDGTINSGTGGTVGHVSLFSSLGPTADGRNKPEVVAPGEPIISTKASNITVNRALLGDESHFKLEGTSMAAPHVTGIIALLLQKNNCLTLAQVKDVLQSTADVSTLTSYTTDPADTYGSGIVNALAAMLAISPDTSCYAGSGPSSSSGCGGMIVPTSASTVAPALALLLSPLAVIVWRRRR